MLHDREVTLIMSTGCIFLLLQIYSYERFQASKSYAIFTVMNVLILRKRLSYVLWFKVMFQMFKVYIYMIWLGFDLSPR